MTNYNVDVLGGLNAVNFHRDLIEDIQAKEAKKKEETHLRNLYLQASEMYAEGDADKIAEFSLQNPEIGDMLTKAAKFHSETTKENYINSIFYALQNPEKIPSILARRQEFLKSQGLPPEKTQETDSFLEKYKKDPEGMIKDLKKEVAWLAPEKYKNWVEAITIGEEDYDPYTSIGKIEFDREEGIITQKQADTLIAGEIEKAKANPNTEIGKIEKDFENELISRDQADTLINAEIKKATDNDISQPLSKEGKIAHDVKHGWLSEKDTEKLLAEKTQYAPSNIRKMMIERDELIKRHGKEHPDVKAIQKKIEGEQLNIPELNSEQIEFWGAYNLLTGKMPSLGRGKDATKLRVQIAESAAKQALAEQTGGVSDIVKGKNSFDSALKVLGSQADTKAIQAAETFAERQVTAAGSYIENMGFQIDQVSNLVQDLKTFDTRLLNIPLRYIRGRLKGSPLQAKYDMYLAEISREMARLAAGSPQSIAEISVEGQKKWDKIHDLNLSAEDMLSLLGETRHAALLRYDSMKNQLDRVRKKMRTRDYDVDDFANKNKETISDSLPEGSKLIGTSSGKNVYEDSNGNRYIEE